MEPAGAERLRGFRAPGADVAAGSASSPAQGQPERSESAQVPATDRGDQFTRLGHGWRWAVSTAAVLVVAVVIIAALAFKLGSGSATSANRASATATPTPAATATPLPVTDLYRQVVPSVVLITTSKGSLGSGVIVTDTGTVLTANHVISGGGSISILFADGTKTSATVAQGTTVAEARRRFPLGSTKAIVLVDEGDRYAGTVSVSDLHQQERDASASVSTLARGRNEALRPDMNVKEAIAAFSRFERDMLVVTAPETEAVLGTLSEAYSLRRYAEEMNKRLYPHR